MEYLKIWNIWKLDCWTFCVQKKDNRGKPGDEGEFGYHLSSSITVGHKSLNLSSMIPNRNPKLMRKFTGLFCTHSYLVHLVKTRERDRSHQVFDLFPSHFFLFSPRFFWRKCFFWWRNPCQRLWSVVQLFCVIIRSRSHLINETFRGWSLFFNNRGPYDQHIWLTRLSEVEVCESRSETVTWHPQRDLFF